MVSITPTQLASWTLCFFVLAVRAQSGCNRDECYNALFPCDNILGLAEAVNYCSTVGHYGATNYPARATAACGNTDKRAYISACACGVACPSFSPTATSSSTTIVETIPTTLTTSTTVGGGNGQSSPGSLTLVPSTSSTPTTDSTSASASVSASTSASISASASVSAPTSALTSASVSVSVSGSTSASLTSNSTISSTLSVRSSVSETISVPTTTTSATTILSGTGQASHSSESASTIETTTSGRGSSLTLSVTTSVSTTTGTISTIVTSDIPVSVPSNTSSILSTTGSHVSGRSSSILLSTFTTSTISGSATIPSGNPMSSSSARWTNSTCISESTSTNPANGQTTGSSTMLNPTAPTSASPLTSSGIIVINSTTTSAGSLLTSSGSSSDPTPVTPITVSGITPSDTTCVETPTGSSFHYFPNSTIHEVTPTPLPGGSGSGYLSTGVPFPFPSSALNHTFSKSTSTFGSPISTSSNSDPSCTSAPAIDSTVENGDFETGLSPWSVDLVDIVSTSYKVTGPGADGSCGAFRVDMRRNLQTDDLRANLRLVSPLIAPPQPPGSKWVVSFWVRFGTGSFTNFTENYDASDGSYVNLYANGAVAHRVDATSVDTGGNWTHVKVPYLTASNERMLQLVFSFALGDKAETNEVWIDRVAMDAVTETSSTAVGPVSAGVTSKPVVAQG